MSLKYGAGFIDEMRTISLQIHSRKTVHGAVRCPSAGQLPLGIDRFTLPSASLSIIICRELYNLAIESRFGSHFAG
jgi:hypothetical protein